MTARRLIELLAVVDEDILAEAIRQPTLMVQASRYRVAKMRDRAQAIARLDAARAELALKIRNKKDAAGRKMTEGALKERLELSPTIRRLREESDRAYEGEELAKLILESFRQRNSAIKIVADVRVYEGSREGAEVESGEMRRRMVSRARTLQAKAANSRY